MGYCMNIIETEFKMSAALIVEAFPIVKKALLKELKLRNENANYKVHFAWVRTEVLEKANSLADVLSAFRWELELDDDGSAYSISFNGEKLGDEKLLFDFLARFVENESYIQMSGEEGHQWRWIFEGGHCFERSATITFD